MKFINEEIIISTQKHVELINITSEINQIIENYPIQQGLINISTKHTTTAILINEDENGLKQDILNSYEKIIPSSKYLHDRIDNNARSHLKSIISPSNQTLPVIDGKISMGQWQSIFFAEFDGPRKQRKINITIIK